MQAVAHQPVGLGLVSGHVSQPRPDLGQGPAPGSGSLASLDSGGRGMKFGD